MRTFAALAGSRPTPAGLCGFETVKPGRVPGNDGRLQAPHINVVIFARGLLKHLHTRVYFAGDPANAGDAVLALVPEARRATLLAQPVAGQSNTWRWRYGCRASRKPSSSTCKIDSCSRD